MSPRNVERLHGGRLAYHWHDAAAAGASDMFEASVDGVDRKKKEPQKDTTYNN